MWYTIFQTEWGCFGFVARRGEKPASQERMASCVRAKPRQARNAQAGMCCNAHSMSAREADMPPRSRGFGELLTATFLPQSERSIRRRIASRWADAVEVSDLLPRFRREVIDYYAGKAMRFTVDIDLADMPPFRRAVLTACRRIPYGKTASYADLARAVGKPGAARAVGGAMAANPLPLVIPCHRILRSDGSLGGFSSPQGVKKKLQMLRLEEAQPPLTRG